MNDSEPIYRDDICCICKEYTPCAHWRLMIHNTLWANFKLCRSCWDKISDFIDAIRN